MYLNWFSYSEPRHDKTSIVTVRPAKAQISLGIRPVWSESLLTAWRKLGSLTTHWAHSEDSDQTGRRPRPIWVFAGRTAILLVLSCRGSFKYVWSATSNYFGQACFCCLFVCFCLFLFFFFFFFVLLLLLLLLFVCFLCVFVFVFSFLRFLNWGKIPNCLEWDKSPPLITGFLLWPLADTDLNKLMTPYCKMSKSKSKFLISQNGIQ